METEKILKKGLITGIGSAILMAFYFLMLSLQDANSLGLHNFGKIFLVLIPMFLLYRQHFHSRGKLEFKESILLGLFYALSAAIVLVIGELLLHNIFGIPLTPEEFLESNINTFALYFLLTLEIFGYSLLSIFLGFQFYKNRVDHNIAT